MDIKITLTATNVASNPSKAHRYRSLPQAIRVALVGRCLCRRSLQVKILSIPITSIFHGGLIGFLRNYQTIKNCNFVYSGNIDTSYATNCSGTMGLIAALSLGTIDNCSLTVNGKIKYYSDTTWNGNIGTADYGAESRTQHSFALGGFVGTMTSATARVSNSKITLNNNFELSINARNKSGGTAYHDPYSRCWTGGIVGWMANSAQAYNIVTRRQRRS